MKTAHLKRRAKEVNLYFEDGLGIWLHEVQAVLGPRDRWPKVRCVHDDDACAQMHERFDYCMVCGGSGRWDNKLTVHHLVGGPMKCDSLANLIVLCADCHEMHQSQRDSLKLLLRAKFTHDRLNLSYVRTCHLLGRYLPFDSLADE